MAITISGTTITLNDASTLVSTSTFGAIGSALILQNFGGAVSTGDTTAGSNLKYNTSPGMSITTNAKGPGQTSDSGGGTAVSGTWRSMNSGPIGAPFQSEGTYGYLGLFVRSA